MAMNMRQAREEAEKRWGKIAMLWTSPYNVRPDGTRMKLVGVMSDYDVHANWLGQGWTWEDAFESAERQIQRNLELTGRRW